MKESTIVPASGSMASSSHPSSTAAGGGSARPSITSQNGPRRSPVPGSIFAMAHSIWELDSRHGMLRVIATGAKQNDSQDGSDRPRARNDLSRRSQRRRLQTGRQRADHF